MTNISTAILAEDLYKRYGKTQALSGLSLSVPEGTILGLLGPNGAGKTTVVRILTTLLAPDSGSAQVAGIDVVRHPDRIRSLIGLAGQNAAVDEYLTGRENLEMFGRLYHLPVREARNRADTLLERFDLAEAASRPVKTYSGGMRRRLDLAASLVISPPVLFLDEPTTGLDPRSRIGMWDVIGELVAGGATVLLTTQYLDEADRLADRIAVVDHGKVIAAGTSDELKARVGGERLELTVPAEALERAAQIVGRYAESAPSVDAHMHHLTLPVINGSRLLPDVVRDLDAAGIRIDDLALRHPTLDDVFLTLTGRAAEEAPAVEGGGDGRRNREEVA